MTWDQINTLVLVFFNYLSGKFQRTLLLFSGRELPIYRPLDLAIFINNQASHLAQTSLYGCLRARAGGDFPRLFNDPDFVAAVNVAKWRIWLAAVGDLAIFAGGLLTAGGVAPAVARGWILETLTVILDEAGRPVEAGDDFAAALDAQTRRVAADSLAADRPLDAIFHASPAALATWGPWVIPVVDNDLSILRNSVRYRCREPRAALRRRLNVASFVEPG